MSDSGKNLCDLCMLMAASEHRVGLNMCPGCACTWDFLPAFRGIQFQLAALIRAVLASAVEEEPQQRKPSGTDAIDGRQEKENGGPIIRP